MKHIYSIITSFFFVLLFTSCTDEKPIVKSDSIDNEVECKKVLNNILKSLEEKDIEKLISTMSPNENMELILTGTPPSKTSAEFVDFHKKWFLDEGWSMKTKVLSLIVDENLAVATTEQIYREPERNGKPYFNRMLVSYVLEKINDKWYVTKDQANSIEKSVDQ